MKGAVQGLATTHREHAGEEIAGRAAAFGELLPGSAQSRADLEYTGQVQADGGHHIGQCRDHHRLLQLEAPAQREAGAAQRERQAADRGEAHQHAQRVPERAGLGVATAAPALGQRQRLERQHRQHAGHQVQDQAAAQRQQQGEQQRRGCGLALVAPQGRGGDDLIRCSRRQGHLHATRHRRIADAVGLAALERGFQPQRLGFGPGAPQRQRHFDLVEVHHHLAEVFVLMRRAWRPARRGQAGVGIAHHAEAGTIAIQVIARRGREAQQQFGGGTGDGFETKRLLLGQRQRFGGARGRCRDPAAERALQGIVARRTPSPDCGGRLEWGQQLGRRLTLRSAPTPALPRRRGRE
jgi:hypothetical protein